MIIDFHSHFFPPEIVRRHLPSGGEKTVAYVRGVPAQTMHAMLGDMGSRLRDMDVAEIDTAVLSAPLPQASVADCRLINGEFYRLAREHRGRLVPLAHVPALAGDAAIEELERCVADLGLVIFIHPALFPIGAAFMAEHDLAWMVGREFGMILAVTWLVAGGVLDAFPSLRICLSHCAGGALPLVGRMRGYLDRELLGTASDPKQGTRPARPVEEYLRELFYDTGGFFGDLTAVRASLLVVPPSQFLFGTDYPQEIRTGELKRDFVRAIQTMDFPPADRDAILGGNAARLLRLH